MRIIHILTDFNGGIGSVVESLISKQVLLNSVVVIYSQGDYPNVDGVVFIKLKKHTIAGFNLLFGLKGKKNTIKNLLKNNKQKTIFHFHNLDSLGLFNIFTFSKKSIITIHGIRIPSSSNIRNFFFSGLIVFALLLLNITNFKIVFVSVNTKNHYLNLFKIKRSIINVIYNGVDKKFNFIPQHSNQNFGIGFISDLSQNKGFNILLESIENLNKTSKNIHFYIAGINKSNFLVPNYHNVTYFGYKKKVIDEIFSKLDVIVLPSISEGLPMILIEAISYGIPIISTKVGGIPEICINNFTGIIIDRNYSSLVESILKLYNDRKLLKKLSQNSLDFFKVNFEIESITEKYLNLYDKILTYVGK